MDNRGDSPRYDELSIALNTLVIFVLQETPVPMNVFPGKSEKTKFLFRNN